jgi:hypothetical protein
MPKSDMRARRSASFDCVDVMVFDADAAEVSVFVVVDWSDVEMDRTRFGLAKGWVAVADEKDCTEKVCKDTIRAAAVHQRLL